jgi:hypothetical protein
MTKKFFNGLFMIIQMKLFSIMDYFRIVNFEFKPFTKSLQRNMKRKQQGPKLKSARI